MHYDFFKMVEIDQIDITIKNIIEIEDKKRLVRFFLKRSLVVENEVWNMILRQLLTSIFATRGGS